MKPRFYKDYPEKIKWLKHYDLRHPLSFCCRFNYLIGGKGYGKTFSVKFFIFREFINNGYTFGWCRSTDTALDNVRDTNQFFIRMTPVFNLLGITSYKVKGSDIYINDLLAGHFFAISTFYNQKGADYICDYVVWDEFMREDGERPVPFIRQKFFKLLEAIGRDNVKRVFFISNSTNKFDDMLKPYDIDFSNGHGVYVYRNGKQTESVLIHFIESSKHFKENKLNSASISGMSNDERIEALENEFKDFGEYFNPKKAVYRFSIQVGDSEFISVYTYNGGIYILGGYPHLPKMKALNSKYINSTVTRLTQNEKKALRMHFDTGNVVFKDGYCRTAFQDFIANKGT